MGSEPKFPYQKSTERKLIDRIAVLEAAVIDRCAYACIRVANEQFSTLPEEKYQRVVRIQKEVALQCAEAVRKLRHRGSMGSEIQRYYSEGRLVADDRGQVVLFNDYQRIVEALMGERDRQYEFNAGAIAKIAALEARVKPKCPDCNAVGMSHCSDPENCGGVYWPDHMYRKLEAQVAALSKPASDEEWDADWTMNTGKDFFNEIIRARHQPAPEETKS